MPLLTLLSRTWVVELISWLKGTFVSLFIHTSTKILSLFLDHQHCVYESLSCFMIISIVRMSRYPSTTYT